MTETTLDRPAISVRAVLEMSSVQRGDPQIAVGGPALDAPIRWVHIVSEAGLAGLIEGGELILTTGAAWPDANDELVAEVNELINANISGLLIELGTRFQEIPPELVDLCRKRGVALIALQQKTPFVQITEQVHRSLLIEQADALAARDEVQTMLTKLGLNRAPVDYVVAQLAEVLQAPVIFESELGEVMSWANPLPDGTAERTLSAWPRNLSETLDSSWNVVPVEARDVRWGRLIACAGPPHPAGRQTVLELGAVALALGRLAEPLSTRDAGVFIEADGLLESIVAGRYTSDDDITAQLTAAGFSLDSGDVRALSVQLTGDAVRDSEATHRALRAVREALGPSGKLLVAKPQPRDGRVVGLVTRSRQSLSEHDLPLTANLVDRALGAAGAEWGELRITIGPPARSVSELVASMQLAHAARMFVATESSGRVALADIARQPLAYLVSEMRTDLRMQQFAQRVLGDLLEADRAQRSDLIRALRAYVAHPTNRSDAAQAANLSRSVFYQRIARIEEILDVDLTDGTTIATLYLALALTPAPPRTS